ncbi:acetyl-CoA hydrolase/transferase family protein [Selenomonas sp. TAMA-11512]|uniref:acetyl-CoA hydrolase/transferase family protein n=1 Tax=Selenomonas sp. TAMA-11512 TaxID=3095337 RepID=UPI003088F31E|nr:acetyl-CoA hydrolase/transferase family protein [Selenomonas sp. TAMA-11512]
MIDIKDRVRNRDLHSKIVSAEEAAAFFKPGMNVAMSGFTASSYPKAVPIALAERMKKEPFTINLWTGASTGPELDHTLAEVKGIKNRIPYQTDAIVRKQINDGTINYQDIHLSMSAQNARYGFYGDIDVCVVEAVAITEEGNIIPSTSLGNAPSYVQQADKIIVEVNTSQPLTLEGMHDVYVPLDPPNRLPIPIVKPDDRIGTPYIPCTPEKIMYIVPCDITDKTRDLAPIDENSHKMADLTIQLLKDEVRKGHMPKNLLPLQSGVGNVANAVIAGFVDSDFEHLIVSTEVIQDGMLDLIDAGKLDFCAGTAFSPSPAGMERFYKNVEEYKKYLLLRPQEVSNHPEVVRRIGVIGMNTAIEVDIYGNVNSTHICGTKMMNGIGGSCDFSRNSYLTIFYTPSIAKNGAISSVVPFCSHVDHTEADVDIIISEQGVADLRNKSPKERAKEIIENVAHPDYRPMLRDYFERAVKETGNAHTPHILSEALSFHERFVKTGTMKK